METFRGELVPAETLEDYQRDVVQGNLNWVIDTSIGELISALENNRYIKTLDDGRVLLALIRKKAVLEQGGRGIFLEKTPEVGEPTANARDRMGVLGLLLEDRV